MPLVPCLLLDGQAEAAANFYVAAFRACGRPASVDALTPCGEAGPGSPGSVLMVEFTLDGQPMMGVNGGPQCAFTWAVSLSVTCADQGEIDRFWERLGDGGAPHRCGWLTDRYGLAWQVVPAALGEMMRDPDAARRDRVMRAVYGMGKLDLAALRDAYEGKVAA